MREEEFSRVLRKVKHFFSKCFPVAQFGDRNNVTCCREKSVAYQKKNTVREAFFLSRKIEDYFGAKLPTSPRFFTHQFDALQSLKTIDFPNLSCYSFAPVRVLSGAFLSFSSWRAQLRE